MGLDDAIRAYQLYSYRKKKGTPVRGTRKEVGKAAVRMANKDGGTVDIRNSKGLDTFGSAFRTGSDLHKNLGSLRWKKKGSKHSWGF